jgi:hypothetical protein
MTLRGFWWLGLAVMCVEWPLSGQIGPYPGQYPPGQYPPGQYPPGQYPGQGPGLPFPRRSKKNKNKDKDKDQVELQSTDGMLRSIRADQIILESDDSRILSFKRTSATKFSKEGEEIKPSEFKPGDHLRIDASQDDQGYLTAVNVMWQQDGTPAERAHAAEPVDPSPVKEPDDEDRPVQRRADSAAAPPARAQAPAPPAAEEKNPADLNAPVKDDVQPKPIDAGDEDRPVLKRGRPAAASRRTATAPEAEPEPEEPVITARNEPREAPTVPAAETQRPEDVAIEAAREAAATFLESLPNYVCQEFMARFGSSSHPASWQPQDIVSTEVIYDNHHERYRNITINGKATKKRMEELPGAWSTGEFGSILADLFSPATAADFEFRKESRTAGRSSMVYDFSVDREHSHWRIMVASQMVMPSYKGSVWIDKETKRVLRIEMQATRLPEAFPADTVESATDYQFVRFGERQFLVPVHAETLSCQRGSANCSRNVIDFRNYHKYSGESTITFDNK